jgi:uncharacterized membrane protein
MKLHVGLHSVTTPGGTGSTRCPSDDREILTVKPELGNPNQQRGNNKHMSTLVVVTYDDPYKGEDVRLKLRKLQSEYLLDLEDAVVAVTDAKGKVKLHQNLNLTAGFWGALIGLIFLSPVLGFAVGATAGTVSDALTDVGIDDEFMEELAATMAPGSSTLFALVRQAKPDKVLEELKGTGGRILNTSLSHEDESKLQAALNAATA